MMLSQNLIFVIVFTVHFHVTTWAQSGRLVGGEVSKMEATKAFRTLGIFLLISVSNTPCLPQTFALQPIQEPKYFPPNCRCRAHVGGRAIRSYEATKFKQDTQGCQKNLFQVINYLLLLLPVQFIHATENNCKEISQDRMHHHVWKTAKLNDLSNCLFFHSAS